MLRKKILIARMKTWIVNRSRHFLPAYSTETSAGMDIRENIDRDVILRPLERALIKTGLFREIHVGYEAQRTNGFGHTGKE